MQNKRSSWPEDVLGDDSRSPEGNCGYCLINSFIYISMTYVERYLRERDSKFLKMDHLVSTLFCNLIRIIANAKKCMKIHI